HFGFGSRSCGQEPALFNGAPWGAAGGGRSARRVARTDAGKVFDRPRMACPKTPSASRVPFAHGCAKGADEGWPFSCLLLFGHAKRSRSGRPKGGSKAPALRLRRREDATAMRDRSEGEAHGGPGPALWRSLVAAARRA